MRLSPILSRRRFFALAGGAALFLASPKIAAARAPLGWEAVEAGRAARQNLILAGYVKRLPGGAHVFSRARYHCDYCYTGTPQSVLELATTLPEGAATLRGKIRGRVFICASA